MTMRIYVCSACLERSRSGRYTEDPCIALVSTDFKRPTGCLYPDPDRRAPAWRLISLRDIATVEART